MSKDEYEKGKQLYKDKDYMKAIDCFHNCFLNNINQIRALAYMIESYFALNNWAKGKELIDKYIELQPNNTTVYYYLGKYWFNAKEYDKAYKDYSLYLEKNRISDEQSIIVYDALYEIKMAQLIYNVAYDHIHYAGYFETGNKPKDMGLKLKEMKALNKLNKYEDILSQFSKISISDHKKEMQSQLMLEKALALSQYEPEESNSDEKYAECISICNDFTFDNQFSYPLAVCYFKQGNVSKANTIIEQYLKAAPNSSEGYVLQGLINNRLKKKKSAYVSYQQAVKCNPKCYDAYIEMVKMLSSIGKYFEAYDEIKDCNPTQEETQMALKFLLKKAELMYHLNMPKEANVLMDQIGEFLRDNNIESKVNPQSLEEALESYFTLFHLKGGYRKEDFDQGTEVLGKGGYGQVTKGRLKNQEVAVKEYIINAEKKEKKKIIFLINCINEMKSMEELSANPHILNLVTMFYLEDKIYILTEYCDGGNLSTLIHNKSIEIPFKRRIEILIQIAKGLTYLHSFKRPFIHFDIKPMNILLVKKYNQNAYNQIKICDFGLTKTSFVFNPQGTPAYIAPELLMTQHYSAKVDVYSFGITMWEVFSRAHPYEGINYSDIYNRVISKQRPDTNQYDHTATNEVKQLITECYAHEEGSRPTIEQVMNRLQKMI